MNMSHLVIILQIFSFVNTFCCMVISAHSTHYKTTVIPISESYDKFCSEVAKENPSSLSDCELQNILTEKFKMMISLSTNSSSSERFALESKLKAIENILTTQLGLDDLLQSPEEGIDSSRIPNRIERTTDLVTVLVVAHNSGYHFAHGMEASRLPLRHLSSVHGLQLGTELLTNTTVRYLRELACTARSILNLMAKTRGYQELHPHTHESTNHTAEKWKNKLSGVDCSENLTLCQAVEVVKLYRNFRALTDYIHDALLYIFDVSTSEQLEFYNC